MLDTGGGGTYSTTDTLKRRQRMLQTREALRSERSSFDAHWQELANYLQPVRTRFQTSDRNRGDRRSSAIIDSTPRAALGTLRSGLHAGITSPARPWFRLTTPDQDLAELGAVKEWLELVTHRLHTIFLRSNIYNALPVLYADLATFATGAMGMLEDDEDLLRCYTYPIGSFVIGLDARGVATVFVYDYRRSVRQLIEEFGYTDPTDPRAIDWSRFSLRIKTLWDEGNRETAIDCCWHIEPNDEYDPDKVDAKYAMRWRSCHYELGGTGDNAAFVEGRRGFLRESGFRTFPIVVPRWDVTGDDTYGTDCPGMTALGDVKQLQFMQKEKGKAIAKAIAPSLKAPPSLKNQQISLLPGGITYVTDQERNGVLAPIHTVDLAGLRELKEDMADTRQRIREAFFADLFLMLAQSEQTQPITAEEVRVRQEEKLIALGPVLERLNDELLDPLIDRAFDILKAAGGVPEPPEELHGLELKVEYISIMAQAQKLAGVSGHERLLGIVINMAQAFPGVRHKFNDQQFVDAIADKLGIDVNIIRTDEEAQHLAAAEQQQIQQAQAAERLKTIGQAAHALGTTPMGQGNTALDAAMQQAQQGAGAIGAPA